ncbi:MAG: competence/damage-inducible protein A [Thermoprotei archaeon]|nr:MAG: competence/damage-inducible protein A [Thermoprotei archaeon]
MEGRKYTAAVVTIGTELLRGLIENTNATWLCKQLTDLGIEVKRVVTVPDDMNEIVETIRELLRKVDIIVTTGGLGFTRDDITVEAIAEAIQQPLHHRRDIEQMVLTRCRELNYEITQEALVKVSRAPPTAQPLPNNTGIVPGLHIEHQGKHIYVLPGVPREMKQIFQDHVKPHLQQLTETKHTIELIVHTRHRTEIEVENKLKNIDMSRYHVTYIKIHPRQPVQISITLQHTDKQELMKKVQELQQELGKVLNIEKIEIKT